MKIDHYSFSLSGGAGQVAQRLCQIQNSQNHNAKFHYKIKGNLKSDFTRAPLLAALAALDSSLISKHSNEGLFSILRDMVSQNLCDSSSSVTHLHWTPGIISYEKIIELANRKGRIVWTLHDMWPFTGGCHHSLECLGYEQSCSACPQVKGIFQRLPKVSFEKKAKLSGVAANRIRIVAPSQWIANQAMRSRILQNFEISVIGNPINTELFFLKRDRPQLDSHQSTTRRSFVIGAVAADLNDPNKGIQSLIDVITHLSHNTSLSDVDFKLMLIGRGRLPEVSTPKNLKIQKLGFLSETGMAKAYNEMNLLVHLAKAENFPNVILEALSSGVCVLARNIGGISEIINDSGAGILISDDKLISAEIFNAIRNPNRLTEMGKLGSKYVRANFSNKIIHEKYMLEYEKLEI